MSVPVLLPPGIGEGAAGDSVSRLVSNEVQAPAASVATRPRRQSFLRIWVLWTRQTRPITKSARRGKICPPRAIVLRFLLKKTALPGDRVQEAGQVGPGIRRASSAKRKDT